VDESRLDMSAIERAIEQMGGAFERPAELARPAVEEWIAETEREQFDTEGAAGASGPWQPLALSTAYRKAAEGHGPRILERTGAMREVLTSLDGIRGLVEASGDKITFRLPAPASYHQRGTDRMPAREVFAPSEDQKARLRARLQKTAAEELRRRKLPVKG
jgi:hypothetical protein